MEKAACIPCSTGLGLSQFFCSNGTLDHEEDAQRCRVSSDAIASESPRILQVLSSLLERTVAQNDAYAARIGKQYCLPSSLDSLTLFHGLKAPSISVQKYVERIFKYANCSPSCFVVAYVYLDRFIRQQPELPITSLNVHRLLITSVMVAAKFLDDVYYNNAYYAKVGGVNTPEMNRLELEFLFRLGFRLQVTVQVFDSYCIFLEREVAGYGGFCPVKSVPVSPLQGRQSYISGAAHQKEVHEADHQQSNVYVAVNVLESVS
ncbi:hypothetical protein KP509_21G011000 [Ceratopteris richardii]|uniref:Cyclin n=1 Tax=Ceratopteris richardii TaxID=49495 RepID=A0A8T2S7J9_CERRI|nr:hypothetical protein KP509_21G011000 [Ceratopteris richardii]